MPAHVASKVHAIGMTMALAADSLAQSRARLGRKFTHFGLLVGDKK